MASRLLRNIAVGIGAGLATRVPRRATPAAVNRPATNLYPLLDRIEEIESRVTRVELAPAAVALPAPEEIEALGTIVSSQSEDIASLRQDILGIERRNAQQVEAFGQKIALLERQVPVHIEASIAARMTELEQRLRGEFQEIHYRTVDAFADTIEKRVVNRINVLENSLIQQSLSISELRDKSLKTDENLHRLLGAVEKLCDRAEAKSQIPLLAPEPVVPPESPAPAQPAPVTRQPDFAESYREALARQSWADPERQPEREHELVGAVAASNGHRPQPSRRGVKPVGMAILGLALLGFRFIK